MKASARAAGKKTKAKPSRLGVHGDEAPRAETAAELSARLTGLVDKANAGDRPALAGLRRLLDDHPEIWETVGDLAARAERAWIELIAGEDALAVESVRRQVAELKAKLNGPHATPTEQLLVDQVASCWLATKQAELAAAQDGGSIEQAAFRLRRVESAQRRYAGATRLLATLRARLPEGLAPINSLGLFPGARKKA